MRRSGVPPHTPRIPLTRTDTSEYVRAPVSTLPGKVGGEAGSADSVNGISGARRANSLFGSVPVAKEGKRRKAKRTWYRITGDLNAEALAAVQSQKYIRVQLNHMSTAAFRAFCLAIKKCHHLVVNVEDVGNVKDYLGIMAKSIKVKIPTIEFPGADLRAGSSFQLALSDRFEPVTFELTSPPVSPGPAARASYRVD